MLSDLSKDLKKVILAGIGAIATTVEKSDEIIKELIKKGEITVEQGKILNEELKHDLCKRSSCCKDGKKDDKSKSFNVAEMTKEEREDLKRRLEELDKYEKNDNNKA